VLNPDRRSTYVQKRPISEVVLRQSQKAPEKVAKLIEPEIIDDGKIDIKEGDDGLPFNK
jgi:hypothetical protein